MTRYARDDRPTEPPDYCCQAGTAAILYALALGASGTLFLIASVLPGSTCWLLRVGTVNAQSIRISLWGVCADVNGAPCSKQGLDIILADSTLPGASTVDAILWSPTTYAFSVHPIIAAGCALSIAVLVAGFVFEDMSLGRLCFSVDDGRNRNIPAFWIGVGAWVVSILALYGDFCFFRSSLGSAYRDPNIHSIEVGQLFIWLAGSGFVLINLGFGLGVIHWFCRVPESYDDEYVWKENGEEVEPQDSGVWYETGSHKELQADGRED